MIKNKTARKTSAENVRAGDAGPEIKPVKSNGNGKTAPRIIEERASFRHLTDQGVAVRLFITCWLVFALHFATNTVREIYPALSLAENFSFDVSEYNGIHPDIFEMPGRGTFINNNPGASILGAVPYFLARPVTDRVIAQIQKKRAEIPASDSFEYDSVYPMAREFYRQAREKGFDVKFGLAAGIMQAFVMAPLAALGAVVMFWLLSSVTGNRRAAVLLALLYAFATPVFYRTAQLNQNVLAAHFALFAFALLWRPWKKDAVSGSEGKPFYFLAGLCTGWTVVLDYSGLVAVLALSGYAFWRWLDFPAAERPFSDLTKFGAGLAVCALVLMAYQWSSFGNPILPAQSYMPPANYTELGYRGFSLPSLDLLFQTAFSIRYGLFVSAPLLLLAFYFPAWLGKESGLFERRELVLILGFTGLFFLFCAANQYGRMQFNTGVRHIVPVVPFVFLLAANVLLTMPRIAAAFFALLTAYWSWCLVMYRDVELGLGVFEAIKNITLGGFQLPWLATLEKMGYVENASAIPLFLLCAAAIWILWNTGARRQDANI